MKYLVIDASLSGTGIRDKYNGGYLSPEELNLSLGIIKRLSEWLLRYENEHFNGYQHTAQIDELDMEGKDIALIIKHELVDVKIEYFSDARMICELL